MVSYFSKVIKHLRYFFLRFSQFGFQIAFIGLKVSLKLNTKNKHHVITSWVSENFNSFAPEYTKRFNTTPLQPVIPKFIWILWWDGMEQMPALVKACYNSVLHNANGYKVNLITKNNVTEYINIPEHIQEKFNRKFISITHLSDIIRFLLLAKHGGLWLDATILVTGPIILESYSSFFTIRRSAGKSNIANRRWTGNCIGGSPNYNLFVFLNDFFSEYWKRYNVLVDYHLIDYAIDFAYNSISQIKEQIDQTPLNNENYMTLKDNLRKEYDSELFNRITENTVFHKLVWRGKYPVTTPEKKQTFFGYIINGTN